MKCGLWLVSIAVLGLGCASQKAAVAADERPVNVGRKYIDPDLGFELVRPEGNWQLDANNDTTSEGVAVPVVLRNKDTGAQVVLQIAPAVATPTQFAERLTTGLRDHPGFTATDPMPVPLSDSAVGFDFEMGEKVQGKVAVVEGGSGRVFMMMATWPKAIPGAVAAVDEIFTSVKPVPRSGSGG
jgi:hypothetical protein